MSEIKAFVGHSFDPHDQTVVRSFLDYLVNVSELLGSFSWEHAEGAEPRQLAEKVKRLMEGKSVFIGICSRRTRIASPESFHAAILRKKLWILESHLGWATSDWIVQEIGYAIGRQMEVILLVERGVQLPGGLQGDVEYIEFDAGNVSAAFPKLLQMIGALVPRRPEAGSGTVSEAPKPRSDVISKESKFAHGPTEDWSRDDYELSTLMQIFGGVPDELSSLDVSYRQSVHGSDPANLASWSAFVEASKLKWGRGGSLDSLRSLARQHPRNAEVIRHLAGTLAHFDRHLESADAYLEASSLESEVPRSNIYLSRAAVEYDKADRRVAANNLLNRMIERATQGAAAESVLVQTIHDLAENRKLPELQRVASERVLYSNPDDSEKRFAIAYEYSQIEDNDMALHHYARIPIQQRTPMAWNNYGAVLTNFGIAGRAVHAYLKAEEGAETLATANLGFMLMNAGFLEEAGKRAEGAMTIKDRHQNVAKLVVELSEKPALEEKAVQEVLARATAKVALLTLAGAAAVRDRPRDPVVKWQHPRSVLTANWNEDKLVLTGEVEDVEIGGILGGAVTVTRAYALSYELLFLGGSAAGTLSRKRIRGPGTTTVFVSDEYERRVLVWFETPHTLRVVEEPSTRAPTTYPLVAMIGAT